ncbi:MAG: hypothetical protein ACPL25_09145, partial [Ignavibacteria bacterium]
MKSYLSRLFLKENRLQLSIVIGFLILILSALIFPYYQNYVDKNWDEFIDKKIKSSTDKIQKFFNDQQKDLINENNLIKEKVTSLLIQNNPSILKKQEEAYKILIENRQSSYLHQIFDSNFKPFAYSDYYKSLDSNLILEGLDNFNLIKENFRTFLIYGQKISDANESFYLYSLKEIEENYQIRNEFIKQNSLVDQLIDKVNLKISILWDTIYFSIKTENLSNSAVSYIPIKFLDGKTAFYVAIQKPEKVIYLQKISSDFGQFQKIVFLIILSILIYSLFRDLASIHSRFVQAIAVTGLVWLYRIVLLILNFPASILEGDIVNPSIYASRFLFGLVKSPLELFITASTLSLNLIVILVLYKIYILERKDFESSWLKSKVLALIPTLIFVLLTPAAIRGFGASFRSFVFDSTIKFFEQPSL